MDLFDRKEKPIIEVKNLSLTYRHRRQGLVYALSDVSFEIFKGQFLGIAGESGSGKSTVCKAIMKLFREWEIADISGEVLYRGNNVLKMSWEELQKIRGRRIAMIFQQPCNSFNPVVKISAVFAEIEKRFSPKFSAEEILETVGLEKRVLDLFPHNLSGGMLQRLQLAVVLLAGAEVIIADEPTSSLDARAQFEIINLLKDLARNEGLTMIFVSHNLRLIKYLTQRMIVFYGGFLVEEGPTEEVMENPLHPYVKDLVKCLPEREKPFFSIGGFPPDLTKKAEGCPYRERCAIAEDVCRGRVPLKRQYHKVMCFYA